VGEGTWLVVAAIVTGIIGFTAVYVQLRHQHRREVQQARAERLAAFSAAAWVMTLQLGDLAQADRAAKAAVQDASAGHLYQYLDILAQIQLLDDADVYIAATDVDRELTILDLAARGKVFRTAELTEARRPLTDAVLAYQRIARRALGSSEIALRLPSGDALHAGGTGTP
jgi:type II secretory pathway pseudopilin PulG